MPDESINSALPPAASAAPAPLVPSALLASQLPAPSAPAQPFAPALGLPSSVSAAAAPIYPISVPPPAAAAPMSLFPIKGRAPSTRSNAAFHRSPEEMWIDHLTELEQWAKANQRDARNDALAFWALKIPAIAASASAGICAQYHLSSFSLFAAAIASFCVIVDGIQPRGVLRNIHIRAFHDIRFLEGHMTSQLRSSEDPENAIRKIIRDSEPERQRIARYIRDAESALKPNQKI